MIIADHFGADYRIVLQWFHKWRPPAHYLEIGTLNGQTLQIATCASIAIDPFFQLENGQVVTNKPECHLFQQTSDTFFAREDRPAILRHPLDLAFLDGMHLCEFLLRDFINVEKHCSPNAVVLLHDCLPVEAGMAERVRADAHTVAPHHQGWWTGDVWRTALALKRFRRDLQISAFDAGPTGLIAITGLDPHSRALSEGQVTDSMLSWTLDQVALFRELGIESTAAIDTEVKLRARFPWAG
jgi:hypothetical protein